jgi:hypothetical protein
MSLSSVQTPATLPHVAPELPTERLILFVIRRMAIGGLKDAHASNALFSTFAMHHHRIQIFMRIFMAELARASSRTIMVAPCCCCRMTASEAALIDVLATAASAPQSAHKALCELLGNPDCRSPLAAAIGLSDALSDIGRGFNAAV